MSRPTGRLLLDWAYGSAIRLPPCCALEYCESCSRSLRSIWGRLDYNSRLFCYRIANVIEQQSAYSFHQYKTPLPVSRSRALGLFAYVVIGVSFIDTMAQLPVLSPFTASLGAGATMIGVVLAAYSLANMLGNLGAGAIIDRLGRKTGIVGGMAVAGMAVALYAVVLTPGQLIGLRIVHGLGGAVLVPAAFAYAADIGAKQRTGRAMGYSGAAVGVAALIGPASGGLLRSLFGFRALFVTLASLMAITALAVMALLPESYREKHAEQPLQFQRRIAPLLRNRSLHFAYIAVFFAQFAMGALAHSLPLTIEALGFSAARTGVLFSVFSLVAILLFVLPSAGLSDRYGRPRLIRVGLALMAVGLALVALSGSLAAFTPAMMVYGAGYGFVFPALCATVVDQTDPFNRGSGFGVFYAVFSLGVAAGPIAAGVATDAGLAPLAAVAGLLLAAQLLLWLQQAWRRP